MAYLAQFFANFVIQFSREGAAANACAIGFKNAYNIANSCLGAIPKPVQAPAVVVFDEVTNGYEPKSISSIAPCAPSANTFLPSLIYY
jgi:hypothetical protein